MAEELAVSKEQLLWKACTEGDLERVNLLAGDETVDVNWVGEDRLDTSLHRACRFGHLEIVRVMLAHPKIEVADPRIDPNKPQNEGATPFYVACLNGRKEVVSLLLADPRIDPNKPKNKEVTPFFMACQKGHKEVVSLLLADPKIDPSKPNKNEATPFFPACQNGRKEVFSLLLADPRIDITCQTHSGETALEVAFRSGQIDVARDLLKIREFSIILTSESS